jgi:hypothetical protein
LAVWGAGFGAAFGAGLFSYRNGCQAGSFSLAAAGATVSVFRGYFGAGLFGCSIDFADGDPGQHKSSLGAFGSGQTSLLCLLRKIGIAAKSIFLRVQHKSKRIRDTCYRIVT